MPMGVVRKLVLAGAVAVSPFAFAADVIIEEGGLTFSLPESWTFRYQQSKLPTGQLMQRWVREPVRVNQFSASPGLIVVVTPVSADANLALLTQNVLGAQPHNVKLVAGTECVKCVNYKVRMAEGVMSAVSPEPPPDCVEYKPGVNAACVYQVRNHLGMKLEPSWAHIFEKDAPYGRSANLVVHAIHEGKLVDLTFIYPKDAASLIQPEIAAIASALRKTGTAR